MISISDFPLVVCVYSGTTQTLLPPSLSLSTSLLCVVVKNTALTREVQTHQ